MNSFHLLRDIESIFDYLESEEIIFLEDFVEDLVAYQVDVINVVNSIMEGSTSSRLFTVRGDFISIISPLSQKLRSIEIGKFFFFMENIYKHLEGIDSKYGLKIVDEIGIPQARQNIIEFRKTYETFLSEDYSSTIVVRLIFQAKDIFISIKVIKSLLTVIKDNLQIEYDKSEFQEELTLFLESEHDIDTFTARLRSIKNLYSELCYLFDVTENEYPLQIIKIESGSLFLKIFGETKVIQTLTIWIEKVVSYLHRNYTNEGKIYSLPNKLEVIENVLETTKKLEEFGIDATEHKDILQKSTLTIVKELNLLLGGEPNVVINDNKLSIKAELQQKYLEESQTHFLSAAEEESINDD